MNTDDRVLIRSRLSAAVRVMAALENVELAPMSGDLALAISDVHEQALGEIIKYSKALKD